MNMRKVDNRMSYILIVHLIKLLIISITYVYNEDKEQKPRNYIMLII